jgi:L-ascorbate metabolism protein UlaG (beta-lactamase superfamily)
LPSETFQAAQDLQAKRLFPVHNSKFKLASHPWDEPLSKVAELSKQAGLPLVTPYIGQVVDLADEQQVFDQWWVGMK